MSESNISFDDTPDDPCVVCLDEINNLSTTDVCNHRFCFECIKRWSEINNKCPFCKRQFTEVFHDFKEDNTHSILKVECSVTCDEDYDVDDESIEIDESIESDEDVDLERTVEGILDGMELQPGESISSRFIGSDLDQNIIRTVIERAAARGLGQPDPFMYGYNSYNEEAFLLQNDTYPYVLPNPSYSSSGNEFGANETSNDGSIGSCFYGKRMRSNDDDDEGEAGSPSKKAKYW